MDHLDFMETQGQAAVVGIGAKVTYGEPPSRVGDFVIYVDMPFILGMN